MRDVAYWPKTFLDEVEQSKVERGVSFWSLGGPSFLYRTPQTTIWIDPYFYGTPDDSVPDAYRSTSIPIKPDEVRLADCIISTHDHVDHCHEGTFVPILDNTEAFCIGPKSSAANMREFGISESRIREVKSDDTLQVGDVEISVYPAYDPMEPHAASFVFSSGGTKLFVSGDTWDGPAIAEIGDKHELDFALLAMGCSCTGHVDHDSVNPTWYMSEEQLIETARKLNPKTLLPFHWDFWRNHTSDISRFFEIYYTERPNFDIKILLIGDSIHFGS